MNNKHLIFIIKQNVTKAPNRTEKEITQPEHCSPVKEDVSGSSQDPTEYMDPLQLDIGSDEEQQEIPTPPAVSRTPKVKLIIKLNNIWFYRAEFTLVATKL